MPVQFGIIPCHAVGFSREVKSVTVINMEPVSIANVLSSNVE